MSAVVSIVEHGPEIRQLRERCGLTQVKLAEAIGTSQQTIDRIERCEVRWSRSIAPALELLRSIVLKMEGGGATVVQASASEAARPADVVVPAQAEIEVYLGGTGGVVIKANDASLCGDEDQVVVIRPENVDAVVAALLRVKAEALAQ